MGNEIELTLTGMAYGGEAFGRDDTGRMVFVPFALPGERVQVRVRDEHKRWARAAILQVLDPSPLRIQPRCPHFGQCGGCHYQHLQYRDQLEVKKTIVVDQLQRIGGFQSPPVLDVIASPEAWNYRNQMQFHIGDTGKLGLVRQGGAAVIELRECHLPLAPVNELWPLIRVEEQDSLQRVSVRTDALDDTMIVFHARQDPAQDIEVLAGCSVIWSTPSGWQVLAGDSTLQMEVLDRSFRVSPASFFQVNTSLVTELVTRVMDCAQAEPGQLVLDLYAGVGLFSLFFAERGSRVIAVESSPSACADFEVNLDPYAGIELYEATAEAALAAIESHPDLILVDPPRAGLGREVIDLILAKQPARLVYVSCDPATMARDSRRLAAGGMQLEQVQPIDLFPQTYHIETVSSWCSDQNGSSTSNVA
ncbi:MAG: class I SAM-dependent RNA methyltransferase [Anaerolineales bacterium]